MSVKEQDAGVTPDMPARTEVTATRIVSLPESTPLDENTYLDFAHLKSQLPMARVLDQLGLSARLRGQGPQRKGPCPIHRGDARGRTFSVNLDEGVFSCFDARCAQHGDVIDLWASVNGMSLRQAAVDLVQTFHLEPAPRKGTEKRHG
jgi:DNA primase